MIRANTLFKTITSLLVLVGMLGVMPAMSWADYRQQNIVFAQHRSSESRRQKMMDELGLSADQKTKINTVRQHRRNKVRPMMEQLKAKRRSLQAYLQSPNATPGEARARQQELSRLEAQLQDQRLQTWFEIRQVLSAEQLQQIQAKRQQRMASRQGQQRRGRRSQGQGRRNERSF